MNLDALYADTGAMIAAGGQIPVGPTTYNGNLGAVNLAKPVDYTGDWGKVYSTAGAFDLRMTVAYYLYLAQDKPAITVPVTAEQLTRAFEHIGLAVCRWKIYTVLNAAGIDLIIRATDHAPATAAVRDGFNLEFVDALLVAIMTVPTPETTAKVAANGPYLLLSFIANAIHRAQTDGHSWITADTTRRATQCYRLVAVAGASKDQFREYMVKHGHDGNHHLSDVTLAAVANALTGEVVSVVARDCGLYNGVATMGAAVHELFVIGDAAKDRWPPGQLGKASVIIGLEMMVAMIHDMCTKVLITGVEALVGNIEGLVTVIRQPGINREVIKTVSASLSNVIAMVSGYATAARISTEGEHPSFDAVGARIPASLAVGKSLALALGKIEPHDEAIQTAVVSALSRIAGAIGSAAVINVGPAGGRAVRLFPAAAPVDTSGIGAVVGETSQAKMIKLLEAAKGGK